MSKVFAVGLSWREAPVAVRERLAFREDEVGPVLQRLSAHDAIAEVMLLSTCNRVEVYGVAKHDPEDAQRAVKTILLDDRGAGDVASVLRGASAEQAIRHVFRVAAALDSLVLGEAQILGQLKASYEVAKQSGGAGPLLSRLMDRAFGVAKRVRTETAIARGAANIASVAVDLAGRVFDSLDGKHVLVVGAGKMSRLAAQHLRRAGVAELVVINRTWARAEALAKELSARTAAWESLPDALGAADVVIASTGARAPVLTKQLIERVVRKRRGRPLVVMDIAVPRDVEPGAASLDDVYVFDIDDLERVVAANLAERAQAAEAATTIVEAEVNQFLAWQRSAHVVPTIRALREHFLQVADDEAAKAMAAITRDGATAEERAAAVQRLTHGMVGKLLHAPQTRLREGDTGDATQRAAVIRDLFGLQVEDQ